MKSHFSNSCYQIPPRLNYNSMKTFLGWFSALLTVPRRVAGRLLVGYFSRRNEIVVFYRAPSSVAAFSLIRQIRKETEMLLSDIAAYQIHLAVKKTEKINGDIAEVGTYMGGSSKIICEARVNNKSVHLFDTFEGLPVVGGKDNAEQFKKGDYLAPFEKVKNYLKQYPNVHFYKGLFPATAGPVMQRKFSFVHLDVDLYESTLHSIGFFYPRMERGGAILSHDYPEAEGVKRAFDEFFADKPEMVVELPGCSQCIVVKA